MPLTNDNEKLDTIPDDGPSFFSGAFDDTINLPYTEEELMEKLRVDFIRTPRDEWIILQNAEYKGRAKVHNKKYGYNYEAHIWIVDFLRIDDAEYTTPRRGLLQIRTKRLRKGGFLASVRELFVGKCRLLADQKGNIVAIESRR